MCKNITGQYVHECIQWCVLVSSSIHESNDVIFRKFWLPICVLIWLVAENQYPRELIHLLCRTLFSMSDNQWNEPEIFPNAGKNANFFEAGSSNGKETIVGECPGGGGMISRHSPLHAFSM